MTPAEAIRARVLQEVGETPHTFYTLSVKLVTPFTIGAHEAYRTVWNQLIACGAIVPVPSGSALPRGPLTDRYAAA